MPVLNINETGSEREKAILVGIYRQGEDDECNRSLDELSRLLDTAEGDELARLTQLRDSPDPKTVIGSGKLAELRELATVNDCPLVVFDCELTPSQIKSIEDGIDPDGTVSVIDRSMLILDIFARHATTNEGKLQIELAQLKYTAPRLVGKRKNLSRIGSGSAGTHTRGAGESKLELDRRRLKEKASALEEELERLDRSRKTMRAARDRSGIPKAAIVGYTNAGKSTLLNRLTDAGILAEDKLFATLDPTTRKYTLPSGAQMLLTDTVGFIRRLPHHLIDAFKSTLDEAVYADILLVICDASDDECEEHLKVTADLLNELGASGKPTLFVFNKCDKMSWASAQELVPALRRAAGTDEAVFISAKTGQGVNELIEALETLVRAGKSEVCFKLPTEKSNIVSYLYQNSEVKSVDYGDDAVTVLAVVDEKTKGQYREYIYCEGT